MNPYQQFVADIARLQREGRDLPLGGLEPVKVPALDPDAPKALIFSPHPDDECIIGGLALRMLMKGMHVINVAVTLGSKKERRMERWEELKGACNYLGLGLIRLGDDGLERVNLKARDEEPGHWSDCVDQVVKTLEETSPEIIFVPHERDWNSTHLGVNAMVMEALEAMDGDFECQVVETEFWGAMDDPNLLVESTPEEVGHMISALSFHVGEVNRNPYHLLTPAWMQDNVRRGGELVVGQGQAPPDFTFGTCYRLRNWVGGELVRFYEGGRVLPTDADPATVLK